MFKLIVFFSLLVSSFSAQSGTMNFQIQVSLTILPTPCYTTSNHLNVSVECGNSKNTVMTSIEKNIAFHKETKTNNTPEYIVTITY